MGSVGALGYMANEPDRLACALHELRGTLHADAHATGQGVAHYVDDRLLINIKPSPLKAATPLEEIVGPLRAGTMVCALHCAGEGGPFKFRSWSGLLLGGSADPEVVGVVRRGIPDFLARNVSTSETHGELAFHRFLANLHAEGRLEDPNAPAGAVAGALRAALSLAAPGGQAGAMLVTNGRMMLAASTGGSVCYAMREGILACQRCQGDRTLSESFPLRESHRRFRGVLVVLGLTPVPPGFLAVPATRVLAVGRKLDLSLLEG